MDNVNPFIVTGEKTTAENFIVTPYEEMANAHQLMVEQFKALKGMNQLLYTRVDALERQVADLKRKVTFCDHDHEWVSAGRGRYVCSHCEREVQVK